MPQRLQSYFLDGILPSWLNSFKQTDLSKVNNSFPTDIYYSNPSCEENVMLSTPIVFFPYTKSTSLTRKPYNQNDPYK